MNAIIKELIEQAGGVFSPMTGRNFDNLNVEKFAELIIQEYSYDVMNLTSMPEHIEVAARHWGVEL